MRFKAIVAYDGTDFAGFQKQPSQYRTVQREIENGLQAIFDAFIPVIGAGRTDSGVHALGQVIAFSARWRHSETALRNALNANLPKDIAVLQIEQTDSAFHPRFDAKGRRYAYRIFNSPVRHPFYRRQSWWVTAPLDVAKMEEAAVYLVGQHDFATFGQPPQGNNTVRNLSEATWQREGDRLCFTIEANAFLYRMVRSIVGSLKLVGEGTWRVEQFVEALRARDRAQCGAVAPPEGVCLVSVQY